MCFEYHRIGDLALVDKGRAWGWVAVMIVIGRPKASRKCPMLLLF